MRLTKSQENAVNRIFNEYASEEHKIISFKAPTGSGKTFMSAHLISKILDYEKQQGNNKTMFIIATVSDAELPKSFAKKISDYRKYLPFNQFTIEHRESPSNSTNSKSESVAPFNLENNKVLIFGTSSFGKNKLFNIQGILDNFLYEANNQNWNIVYIRDEAHKGGAKANTTGEKEFQSFDHKITETSSFSIQMTATPNGDYPTLELTSEELMDDGVFLLKNKPIFNPLKENVSGIEGVLNESIKKFGEIQTEYSSLDLDKQIRPAMLVQIDSKRKDQTLEEHNKAIETIVNYFENKTRLNYLLYTSDIKKNNCKTDLSLEEASKNDSIYDVIIFKVGASTGWDIPRACMLVQLRDVSSETLNIQTIGRIKRNPYPGLEFNKVTDKYYVYTDYQERTRALEGYHLKPKFKLQHLYSGNLNIKKELFEEEYISKAWEYIKNGTVIASHAKEIQEQPYLEYETQTLKGDVYVATITQKIPSSLKLRLWTMNFIKDNKQLFPKSLVNRIGKFCLENNIKYEVFLFELRNYLSDLKAKYQHAYETIEKDDEYSISSNNSLMSFYQIWRDKESKNANVIDVSEYEEYGYELVTDIGKERINIQYLDSLPEKEAIKKIFDYIDTDLIKRQIKFLAKMPTLGSDIYFEYFSKKDISIHKSFIDFAIVTNDDRVLMVEVKGHDDYDDTKTEALIKAYSKYMQIESAGKIEIAVIYAGKKNGEIKKPEAIIWDTTKNTFSRTSVRDLVDGFFKVSYVKN